MSAAKTFITKLFLPLFSFIVILLSPASTLAGSGLISSIGGATFIQGASHFWVTSSTPTFSGITTAAASVTGTVGSQSVSATADASGNWSWTPTAALSGDNAVTITSGASTASFTLTIGDLPASIASSSAGGLAPAGNNTTTLLLIGGGILFACIGIWGLKKTQTLN